MPSNPSKRDIEIIRALKQQERCSVTSFHFVLGKKTEIVDRFFFSNRQKYTKSQTFEATGCLVAEVYRECQIFA